MEFWFQLSSSPLTVLIWQFWENPPQGLVWDPLNLLYSIQNLGRHENFLFHPHTLLRKTSNLSLSCSYLRWPLSAPRRSKLPSSQTYSPNQPHISVGTYFCFAYTSYISDNQELCSICSFLGVLLNHATHPLFLLYLKHRYRSPYLGNLQGYFSLRMTPLLANSMTNMLDTHLQPPWKDSLGFTTLRIWGDLMCVV